jgi:hypothetical protein
MISIAMIVLTTITRLEKTDAAVSVTTDWMPPDVVRQAALDLARARLGEEAQRHPLEMAVQRVAQVLHHALADDVVEVALSDADEPGHDRHRDHQADVQVQQREVLLGDRDVDEELEQVRVDDAQQARDDDGQEDDGDARAIRPEEAKDSAHRRATLALAHRGRLVAAAAHHATHAASRSESHRCVLVLPRAPLDPPRRQRDADSVARRASEVGRCPKVRSFVGTLAHRK